MAVLHVSEWKIMPEREGIKAREKGKKKQYHFKRREEEAAFVCFVCVCVFVFVCKSMCVCMLASVGVWLCAPTCRRVDKLQNQGPAGDNARSTGQKVPEDRQPIKTHYIKPQQM